MRLRLHWVILLPLNAFASFVHQASNVAIKYPDNTTTDSLPANVIPGATSTNDFVTRLTIGHRTAMFGTFDAYCQHAIFPVLRRYGDNWSTPSASECTVDNIDLTDPYGWAQELHQWQYAPQEARDFTRHSDRFSGIYQLMTGAVYNTSMIDWARWGASATPGQLLSWRSSTWTTNYFDIVSAEIVQRYMLTLPELGGDGIVENAFFKPWGHNPPVNFAPDYFAGCDKIMEPINKHIAKNLALRTESIQLSNVLSRVAAENQFTGIHFRPSERLWWWSFAYPNAILAAADLSCDDGQSSGSSPPRLVTQVRTVSGEESAGLYAESIPITASIVGGVITGFKEDAQPNWREILSGDVSSTNTVITSYPSAGVDLKCVRGISLYGSFFEPVSEGILLELANRLIPAGDSDYHEVQALYSPGIGAIESKILYSFDDLPGDYQTYINLTYADKQCVIDVAMVDAELVGKVWHCGSVLPFLESCPESAYWPLDRSWRATKPHPICGNLIGDINLTHLACMMTTTNAADVAGFSAVNYNSGWSSMPADGIAEFSCRNTTVKSSIEIDDSASGLFRSLLADVHTRAATSSGLNLTRTAEFTGATAAVAAREYFNEQISRLPSELEVSLEMNTSMMIRRIGPGDTAADFELSAKDGVGPIRRINNGLHFTFSHGRSSTVPYRPACSEAVIDRTMTITKWRFPAMRLGD